MQKLYDIIEEIWDAAVFATLCVAMFVIVALPVGALAHQSRQQDTTKLKELNLKSVLKPGRHPGPPITIYDM
jgi:hypothetical protein